MISGGQRQYIARSAAQVASTSGAWTQVISPAANTNGVYVSHLVSSSINSADWRAHTSTPSTAQDGIEIGRVGGQVSSSYFAHYRFPVEAIIPAGQGVYVSSNGNSTIFYQVL